VCRGEREDGSWEEIRCTCPLSFLWGEDMNKDKVVDEK
jgi:hypothetical protein